MQILRLDDITVEKHWHHPDNEPEGEWRFRILFERYDDDADIIIDRAEMLDLYQVLTILMATDFSRTVTLP